MNAVATNGLQMQFHHIPVVQDVVALDGGAVVDGFAPDALLGVVVPMFKNMLGELEEEPPGVGDVAKLLPEASGLVEFLDEENLDGSLDGLILSLTPDQRFASDAVNVMSIHKSKGLQASVVFISGLVDGILPNSDRGLNTIEAQRRLLFVGMSRARDELHLLSTVEWDGKYVNKVDKSQFTYDFRSKCYKGRSSKFIGELA